jgi:hypothetical protein
MENLRLKFKLHGLEFEIEGKEDIVRAEFSQFKEYITGQLLPKINVVTPANALNYNKPLTEGSEIPIEDITSIQDSDFPILQEVVKRDLPKNEPDWILIYCFYASKFGEKSFTEQDIKKLYEDTKRKSLNRQKNFIKNFNSVLNKQYIKNLNETEFLVKEKGIKQAATILSGQIKIEEQKNKRKTKGGKPKNEKTGKKSSQPSSFKLLRDLNLHPDNEISLNDFAATLNYKSNNDKILLVVYYLQETLKIDKISIDHIYTGFDNLGEKIPKSLYQQISDTKNKNGWLNFDNMEDIKVSIQGRNHVKLHLKKKLQ